MFTGIVEEVGEVAEIKRGFSSLVLAIKASEIVKDIKHGDSISVNGVCLTVTDFNRNSFSADVMPETFRKTNLSKLRVGSAVNLERAMRADGRFGGHMVLGHVDGVGKIISTIKEDNAVIFRIQPPREVMRYIVKKGSIAVDGISLTIALVDSESFGISVIPHTIQNTNLKFKGVGDLVNLEVDIVGKYIEKYLNMREEKTRIDLDFLKKRGF